MFKSYVVFCSGMCVLKPKFHTEVSIPYDLLVLDIDHPLVVNLSTCDRNHAEVVSMSPDSVWMRISAPAAPYRKLKIPAFVVHFESSNRSSRG